MKLRWDTSASPTVTGESAEQMGTGARRQVSVGVLGPLDVLF